ncbi:MAG: L-seryl-tRNA(Sec) selenium transferase [Lachnospiraceae bacterium]|jgi:L-seryl-tRNA(Ser) seleniumtransferase|nr:L-seryl-tRNA(Sec) selenium transferase [Lachnospiraceae bacterium]
MDKNQYFRKIPKVDAILADDDINEFISKYGHESVMNAIHEETANLRRFIAESEDENQINKQIEDLNNIIMDNVSNMYTPNMKHVINATGTILHTNLGRALISRKHMKRAFDLVCGYSNLEYNLEQGKRGERYSHFADLICKITGAEAAMAVNNNASSVLLILTALAKGGEVITSRGELIEIGGKFRIPDVCEASGARLVEVGTTNKTHLEDYENAITEDTKAFLKVHTSNYQVVGFTESVDIEELTKSAHENNIPIIEDLGSGVLVDLENFGLRHEPKVQESIAKGADIVCFSGDKLLGGPQAGIIIGKKKYIDLIKRNQLTRAVRIDKFTAAILEQVFMEYLSPENVVNNIPVLNMISKSISELYDYGSELRDSLLSFARNSAISIESTESQIGGGSLPTERLDSVALVISPMEKSAAYLESEFRKLPVPIICRVFDDKLILDLRTIREEDKDILVTSLSQSGLL